MVFIDLWHKFRQRDRELAEKHAPVTADEVPAITDEATEIVPSPLPMLSISTNDYSNWPEALNGRHAAMHSSDFLACESVKIRAIRTLPVHIMERRENGRYPADNHPMSKLLHRPNALMSWGELIEWLILRKDVFGTAYARVVRNILRQPTEIRPVLSDVKVSFDKKTGLASYSGGQDKFNEPWVCGEDELIIVKTDISTNGGITGKSIAEISAQDIGLSVDLHNFYEYVLKNGNHMGGWLEHPDKLTTDDVIAIRESLDMQAGMDGAGKTRIYDRGLTYHPVSMQIADMSLVDQERFVLEKVCRACHVDKRHVYAETGSGSPQDNIDFVSSTVLPEITAIEQAFQPALDGSAYNGFSDSGYRLKFNVNGLLRGDFKTRMEGYRIAIYAGMFTRAYCCSQEDVPWLAGQDKLLQPTAYYMVDDEGNPYIPAEPTAGTSGQSDGVSGIDQKAVGNLIKPFITDALERIEKRAKADGDTQKTRDFAAQVTNPVITAAAMAGEFMNLEEEINQAIERGTNA